MIESKPSFILLFLPPTMIPDNILPESSLSIKLPVPPTIAELLIPLFDACDYVSTTTENSIV